MEENVSPEPASSPGRCLLPYPHRDFNSACLSCRSKCAFRSCSAFRSCRTLFTWTKALLKSTHSRAFWCSFPKGTWFCLCLGQTRSPCITAWTSRSSTPSHAFRPFRACTCAHGLSTKRHAQIFRRLPFRQLGYHAENLNPKRSKFSYREKPTKKQENHKAKLTNYHGGLSSFRKHRSHPTLSSTPFSRRQVSVTLAQASSVPRLLVSILQTLLSFCLLYTSPSPRDA